jgi:sugar phosphate isomerase/epimerase
METGASLRLMALTMTVDRRGFVTVIGSAALALAARPLAACSKINDSSGEALPEGRRKLSAIGLQLYTVRDAMKQDMTATIQQVAAIGYREVEFAGYFGRTPAEVRALLEQNGLRSPSSHVAFPDLAAGWSKVLDDAKAVGHEYVTVPWIDEKIRTTADDYRRTADLFNQAAERAKAAGLRFAYHNHDFEFKPTEGVIPFDVLLERTDRSLVEFEMDLYWVVHGGHDPIDYLTRYPGRFSLVHVKDSTAAPALSMVDVGQGTIDFKKIFAFDANGRGGAHVKHFFVEHDQPAEPMRSIKTSFDYLKTLEY